MLGVGGVRAGERRGARTPRGNPTRVGLRPDALRRSVADSSRRPETQREADARPPDQRRPRQGSAMLAGVFDRETPRPRQGIRIGAIPRRGEGPPRPAVQADVSGTAPARERRGETSSGGEASADSVSHRLTPPPFASPPLAV